MYINPNNRGVDYKQMDRKYFFKPTGVDEFLSNKETHEIIGFNDKNYIWIPKANMKSRL
jgi:hypothetical protein